MYKYFIGHNENFNFFSEEDEDRPPSHLRGRDIGMWYAKRSRGRKGLSGAAGADLAAREPARIRTKADKAYIQQHSHVSFKTLSLTMRKQLQLSNLQTP